MHGLPDPTASLTNAARASGCEACPKATGSPTEMTADAGPFATGPRGSMRRRPGAAGRRGAGRGAVKHVGGATKRPATAQGGDDADAG